MAQIHASRLKREVSNGRMGVEEIGDELVVRMEHPVIAVELMS